MPRSLTYLQSDGNTVPAVWDGKVKNLVYDSGSLSWIPQTQSGGGGGGDATAANQLNEIDHLQTLIESVDSIGGKTVEVNTNDVKVTLSVLPTGAATSANQTSELTKLDTLHTDLAAIDGHVDGLETLVTSTNTKLDTLHGDVDGLETLVTSSNTKLDTIHTDLTGSTTLMNDVTATGTLTTSGTNVRIDCTGLGTVMADIQNLTNPSDVVSFFGSVDGSTYFTVVAVQINSTYGYGAQIPTGADAVSIGGRGGLFKFAVAGYKYLKLQAANNFGTTVTVFLRGNAAGSSVIEGLHDILYVKADSTTSFVLPTGASTEASLAKLPVTQGSTTSGQSGPLAQTATTTNSPVYTTAKTNPISTDTAGNTRVSLKDSTMPALAAGAAIIGKVGIDQTTPGTTNGVQVNAALPAGTNLMGKVGIDQTTPGTTNGVQVNAALPAGSAIIGNIRIDQTTPGTTNAVQANAGTNLNTSALNLETTQTAMSAKLPATLGQKAMAASMAVVLASDQAAIPVTASAGTNLNTSALALESGGNLATLVTQTDGIETSLSTLVTQTDGIETSLSTLVTQSDTNESNNLNTNQILLAMLREVQALRLATVALACEGGRNKDVDFDPENMAESRLIQ